MKSDVRTIALMPWQPVNPAHAIERVRLLVQFRQPISEKLAALLKAAVEKHSRESRLVGPTPMQSVTFGVQMSPDGQGQMVASQEGLGWQYVRSSSAHLPLEVFAVQRNQIIYETTEYRKWETFMQRFQKVAAEAVDLASSALDLDVLSLEYYDRFFFEGPVKDADPRLLLRDIEKFLHPDPASGRTMWHLHRGWFESSEKGDVLVNQNFDAIEGIRGGRTDLMRTVGVLTKAELRSANHQLDGIPVNDLMKLAHDFTGRYFKEALQEPMLAHVGM